MEKFKKNVKKNWVAIALTVIMLGAFFVRVYEFGDWLYFKMDQSRDAILISKAVDEGARFLPLLGPRAGSTDLKEGFLRLGPAYYYFQYISAVLAGSTQPYVFAYPDLFFSLATVLLLYFFARLYFSRQNALLITTMYAFSFLIIQYSRFAWNPNPLQFFIILSFYGLLRFFGEKNEKRKKLWLALWAFGITIGSQLHFFGFFSLLGISGLMFLFDLQVWKIEKIRNLFQVAVLKKFSAYVVTALAVFMFLYSPVIVSDVMEGGQNTKNFFEALTSKPEKRPLTEKLVKDVKENLRYYCLVTTSECYSGDFKKNAVPMAFTAIILLSGLVLTIRNIRKEKNSNRRNFLALLLAWSAVFFILTIPVSFQLRPRFFIVIFATPFLFLGLIYEYLQGRFAKKGFWLAMIIAFVIIGMNARGTYQWFVEQAKSQEESFDVRRTLILKAKDGVTLGQLQGATDWMYARYQKGKRLYYYVKPEHDRPFEYLLQSKKDDSLEALNLKLNGDPLAQYFAITPADSGIEPVIKKFDAEVKVIAKQQFGQIMVSEIDFPGREIAEKFVFKKKGSNEDRIFWKDVFNSKSENKK